MKKLLLLVSAVFIISLQTNAQISVIVNKSVHESSVSSETLGNIYSLVMTKWNNGSKIIVFDFRSDNTSKDSFYKYLGKDALWIKKEWLRKQLTGEAKAPELLDSDEEVISKVASTPGAIGYVKSSSVNSSVKVIAEIK